MPFLVHGAEFGEPAPGKPAVDRKGQARVARRLRLARREHPRAHDRRGHGRGVGAQLLVRDRRDLYLEIDAVEQRPGQARAVAPHVAVGADAGMAFVAQVAAGTGVHRRDQHHVRGIGKRHRGPGDGHLAVLQGLAQHLQHGLLEFRQFVQEKHPAVGHGHLARARIGAAADEAGVGNGVVRAAEGALREQARAVQAAGHRIDGRDLEGLLEGQRRQHRGDALGEHGLAGTRRADEKQVVRAGRRDLHRALGMGLSLDLGEVLGKGGRVAGGGERRGRARRKAFLAGKKAQHLAQVVGGVDREPGHGRGLVGVGAGDDKPFRPFAPGPRRQGQHARHGLELAGKGEFTAEKESVRGPGGHRLHGREQRERQGQVVARALLAHVGRREVDGDARRRQAQTGVSQRREHPLLALAHRALGKADHGERRHALAGQVDFQGDGVGLDAEQRAGGDSGKAHDLSRIDIPGMVRAQGFWPGQAFHPPSPMIALRLSAASGLRELRTARPSGPPSTGNPKACFCPVFP
ncbi:hypothetical protein DSECCO2_624440 [anaerobic digester metagenome]